MKGMKHDKMRRKLIQRIKKIYKLTTIKYVRVRREEEKKYEKDTVVDKRKEKPRLFY